MSKKDTDADGEQRVAKHIHEVIGKAIHHMMTSSDAPLNSNLKMLLAALSGQIHAVGTSMEVLKEAGLISEALFTNLKASLLGIGDDMVRAINQTAAEHFEDNGHCGNPDCKGCDKREEKRKTELH